MSHETVVDRILIEFALLWKQLPEETRIALKVMSTHPRASWDSVVQEAGVDADTLQQYLAKVNQFAEAFGYEDIAATGSRGPEVLPHVAEVILHIASGVSGPSQ